VLALRLHANLELRLHDEPRPEPGRDEALVRVAAVGLCGSDRHWAMEAGIGGAKIEAPLVLGHEFAGVVESGRFAGRLVAVDPAIPCERCSVCRRGDSNLCPSVRFAGHGDTDGGLREWLVWPERALYPLSDRLDRIEGAMIEPLAVALHAADLAGSMAGSRVAVVGCGPIGLLLIAVARLSGAERITALEPLAHRLAAAAEMGASATIQPPADAAGSDRLPGEANVDEHEVVFDAAGDDAAIATSVELAAPGGQVVLAGIPSSDRTAFRASVARRKGLTFRLVRRSTAHSFRRAVELAERRSIDLASLVTLRVPLADAGRGFAALIDRSEIKVVIEPMEAAEQREGRAA
jgi:L-iditol 2-dehydrogenase